MLLCTTMWLNILLRNVTFNYNIYLVHIVKVFNDTFAQSEIIPIFGIMLCVLGLIFY
jgi:hypothetical protein